jgi:hypothetical protein
MSVDPVGAATGGGLSTSNSRTPTDVHNFRLDRSRSDFDDRHVIVANMVYELPFGKSKKWGSNWPGFLNQILGGWGTTGIFNWQSGEPYTLYAGNFTTNNTHTSSVLIVGPNDPGHLQTVPGATGPGTYNVGPLITNPSDPHYNCRNVVGTQTFFCIPPWPGGERPQFGPGAGLLELGCGTLQEFQTHRTLQPPDARGVLQCAQSCELRESPECNGWISGDRNQQQTK